MNLLLFAKELVFKLDALHAAESDYTELIRIQKTVTVVEIAFLQGTLTFVHVFMATVSGM